MNACMPDTIINKFTEFKFTVVNILQKALQFIWIQSLVKKNTQNDKWHIKKIKVTKPSLHLLSAQL